MPWCTSYVQLNMTYKLSSFNKNNSSIIEDVKNLSTKMNYAGLITPQAKTQPPPMKDKKTVILVSSYSIVKYETLVPNILSTSVAIVLKRSFFSWS